MQSLQYGELPGALMNNLQIPARLGFRLLPISALLSASLFPLAVTNWGVYLPTPGSP